MRTIWNVIGIGLILGLAGIHEVRAAATNMWSQEDLAAQRQEILQRMRAEGLSPENSWLKGRRIAIDRYINGVPWSYPRESFAYQWNFDDGSLCGISETGAGITNMRVESGVLRFSTGEAEAHLSWGNYDKTKPALRFGYGDGKGRLGPYCTALRLRVRQSLEQSVWQAGIERYTGGMEINRSGDYTKESADFTLKGTNWQTAVMRVPWPRPPYTGVRLLTRTPRNSVEIDWIEPCTESVQALCRKTLILPGPVRWAKCSVAYERYPYHIYVNGRVAVVSPPYMDYRQLWNYDLDARLFQTGTNVVAVEWMSGGGGAGDGVVDGALLCADGSYHRFDSDTTWTFKQALTPEEWRDEWLTAACDDSGWDRAVLSQDYKPSRLGGQPEDDIAKCWFNPSWKGRLRVEPADQRTQPIYGSHEVVALNVSVPVRADEKQEVSWQVFDEMGDGFHATDRLIKEGVLQLKSGVRSQKPEGRRKTGSHPDDVGVLSFPVGMLASNVAYAVVLRLNVNGQEVEKYRYELAVCGPVSQPAVENPKDYTDGMKLKLIWEMDAASEPDPANFRSVDGNGEARPSSVVTTPLGKFRQPWTEQNLGSAGGGACNYISYKYAIRHPD